MSQYHPYTSASESDTDIDTDTDTDTDAESFIDVKEDDPRYQLIRTPTATNTIKNDIGPSYGAPWDPTTNVTSLKNYTYSTPPKTTKTSLVSIKSLNRDKNVWPTPYNFQLKLPRTYKNVTKFQLVQLSFPVNSNGVQQPNLFLSSLVKDMLLNGVPASCVDTCISITNCSAATNTVAIMEIGRMNNFGQNLITTVSVPAANYSDVELANELTFQSNSTPPFNIISYEDFKNTFMNTRDPSILFSEPGDTFYSKTGIRINRPTKEAIMNTYYSQFNIDILPVITEEIAFVAYHFPILKELIATGMAEPFLLHIGNYTELVSRVTGIFEGLDSPYYYSVCNQLQAMLTTFRKQLTFEYRPINNYMWKHGENQFTTIHNQLHTSIQREVQKTYQTTLNRELSLASLNAGSFQSLKTNLIQYSAIYKHLETNLSSILCRYALVHDYQYHGGDNHITHESTFNSTELAADIQFNDMFSYKSSIGGIYGNYGGMIMNFTNFMDYHSTLSTYYTIVQSTNHVVNHINQTVTTSHHMYISSKYTGILPQKVIDTRGYMTNQATPVTFVTSQQAYVPGIPLMGSMDATVATETEDTSQNTVIYPSTLESAVPISYDRLSDGIGALTVPTFVPYVPSTNCSTICCNYINNLIRKWYSCLPVNTVVGSLTYRLGLTSLSMNNYNIVSTILQYTTTSAINFLMQINDEQGFNNLDITMDENYAVNNDSSGQIKLMAAKILMANIGDSGTSQTLIQNPSIFENTLGKLDRLNIKIYFDDALLTPAWLYLPIQYDVNEWNATFQIDEEVGFINQSDKWASIPSVPLPSNPDDNPYLYLTKKDDA
jgi:hypothetical protein